MAFVTSCGENFITSCGENAPVRVCIVALQSAPINAATCKSCFSIGQLHAAQISQSPKPKRTRLQARLSITVILVVILCWHAENDPSQQCSRFHGLNTLTLSPAKCSCGQADNTVCLLTKSHSLIYMQHAIACAPASSCKHAIKRAINRHAFLTSAPKGCQTCINQALM